VRVKTLYFDIDGTLLDDNRPKPALAHGAFEKAVRQAGFQRLVCVSNVLSIAEFLAEMGKPPDRWQFVFDLCRGVFLDQAWFRQATTFVPDPNRRAQYIDFSGDWWYVDDMAASFLARGVEKEVFEVHRGERILVPTPYGDGSDILDWLKRTGRVLA